MWQGLALAICLSPIAGTHSASAVDDLAAPPSYPAVDPGADPLGSPYDRRGRGVTILRGSPSARTIAETDAPSPPSRIVSAGVIGTGRNLWFVDADGRIHACWLSGTGYVNSLRVTCTH